MPLENYNSTTLPEVPELIVQYSLLITIVLLGLIILIKLLMFIRQSIGFSFKSKSGIIFGIKNGLYAFSPDKKEGHTICFGGSGSGKTSALLIPTLQTWGGSSFNIDISGDISSNVHTDNKLVYEPENPNTIPYNVFGMIDELPATHKNEALEKLAFLLIPPLNDNANANAQFFNNEGRKILTASLIAFYHQGMDFIDICETIVGSSYPELFDKIDNTQNAAAIRYINSFLGANEQNTAGCKQACDSEIKLFATNEIVKNSMRRPRQNEVEFDPKKIERHNVFVVISDAKLDLYAPLVHIITAQVLEYFSSRERTKNNILLSLDEFASFGRLEILPALRKFRKRGVRILALTQSLADLDLIYGHTETKAMLNNFNFKVIFGASDPETQMYITQLVGKKEVKTKSVSQNAHTKTTTTSTTREWIIQPEELSKMKNKLLLIYPDGHMFLTKNHYFKKWFFKLF